MTDTALDEIFAELDVEDPVCGHCGRPMPTQGQWDRANDAERADLLEDGYVSPGWHGCSGGRPDQVARVERSRRASAAFWDLYGRTYKDHSTGKDHAAAIGFSTSHINRKVKNASRGEP